jgi:hypothetical protein
MALTNRALSLQVCAIFALTLAATATAHEQKVFKLVDPTSRLLLSNGAYDLETIGRYLKVCTTESTLNGVRQPRSRTKRRVLANELYRVDCST